MLHAQREQWVFAREKGRDKKERQLKYSVKCSSPTPLPSCDPVCGLVELKGCRLWRQQLAAFCVSGIDRQQSGEAATGYVV